VCDNGEKAANSYKCSMGVKFGLPVVSTAWIQASLNAGHLANTDDFLLLGRSKSEGLKQGKISGMGEEPYLLILF